MATAKKKEEKSESKAFSFDAMDKALSKVPGFELGSMIENNTFSQIDEWIHSGNYLHNAQISGSLFGGIPNSRSLAYVGDPETGKSFLCLNVAREAQKVGYDIIYCETEGAIDRAAVVKFGIDPLRFRYQPIKTVNDFKRFTVQVIDIVRKAREEGQKPKVMIFLDSLGMLTTEKDINDAMTGKDAMDMGLKAKQLRAMFRLITLDLTANKIPLIVTNHTTVGNIGSYTGPTKESAGGDGPVFSLSSVFFLAKKFQVNENDKSVKTGIIITSRPKKTRNTIPTTISLHVGFVNGMNPYVGLEEYATWDSCGVGKGKIVTEKEYTKSGATNGKPFVFDAVDTKTGEISKENLVYLQNDNARWCVKHLGTSLSSGNKLFNKDVFTEQVLRDLDVNVIQKAFKLPDHMEEEEISIDMDLEEAES